jgi:hypothetical protein
MLNLNGDVQLCKRLWFCLFSYIKGILLKSSDWNLQSINIYKNSFLEFPAIPFFLPLKYFLQFHSTLTHVHSSKEETYPCPICPSDSTLKPCLFKSRLIPQRKLILCIDELFTVCVGLREPFFCHLSMIYNHLGSKSIDFNLG